MLHDFNQPLLSLTMLEELNWMILEKGVPFENYFRFADGTVRPICKSYKSRNLSGCLSARPIYYISVSCYISNGLTSNLHVPYKGKRTRVACLFILGYWNNCNNIHTHSHTYTRWRANWFVWQVSLPITSLCATSV